MVLALAARRVPQPFVRLDLLVPLPTAAAAFFSVQSSGLGLPPSLQRQVLPLSQGVPPADSVAWVKDGPAEPVKHVPIAVSADASQAKDKIKPSSLSGDRL
jgi:hypothetical protein